MLLSVLLTLLTVSTKVASGLQANFTQMDFVQALDHWNFTDKRAFT